MDKAINPSCRLCGADREEAHHLIAECPGLDNHREEAFAKLRLEAKDLQDIKALDAFLSRQEVASLEDDMMDEADNSGDSDAGGDTDEEEEAT